MPRPRERWAAAFRRGPRLLDILTSKPGRCAFVRAVLCIGLALGATAPVAHAQEDAELAASVEELRRRLDDVELDNAQLRSMLLDTPREAPRLSDYAIEVAGRIHLDYWAFPSDSPGVNAFETGDSTITPQDRLELRRLRLAAVGRLPGSMFYEIDLEFAEPSEPEFRDLYIAWEDLPILRTLQLGNQKRPYGLDHLNSSNFNVSLERPFVVQAFNRDARRFGLASFGVTGDEVWNWNYGVYNLREVQADGLYSSDHYQLELAGRLARCVVNPRDGSQYFHSAVATNYAEPDGDPAPGRAANEARFRTGPEASTDSDWLDTGAIAGAEFYSLVGLEAVANHGPLQVTAEYMNLWLDRSAGFGDSVHFHGGYLQVAWFLTDHYQPWNRRLGIIDRVRRIDPVAHEQGCFGDALQLAVRWSFADLTDGDVEGGVGETVGAAMSWYWTPRARLQMNALYGDLRDRAPVDGQTFGTYVAIGTRVLIDF